MNEIYFCTKCDSPCTFYEQGLACVCDQPWITEIVEPLNYPPHWVKRTQMIFDVSSIEDLMNMNSAISNFIFKLKRNCNHTVTKSGDSAVCKNCQSQFGWFCETSPSKHCKYSPDDYMQDCCIHCGDPDERK